MIRYAALLITLLGTWFIVQTYFDHRWKAISLRSWLGEALAGLQPGAEGGCGWPPCEPDPGAAYSCHEHLRLQSLAKAIATSSDHWGREGTAWWQAAPRAGGSRGARSHREPFWRAGAWTAAPGLGKSQQLSGASNLPAWYPQVSLRSPEVSTALDFIYVVQHCSGTEGDGGSTIAAVETSFPKAKSHLPKRRGISLLHTAAMPLGGSASPHEPPAPAETPPAAGYGRTQFAGPIRAVRHRSLPWPSTGKLQAEKPQGPGLEQVPVPNAPWHTPLCSPRGTSHAVLRLTPRAAPSTPASSSHPTPSHKP